MREPDDAAGTAVACYAAVPVASPAAATIYAHVLERATASMRVLPPEQYHIMLAYFGLVGAELRVLHRTLESVLLSVALMSLVAIGAGAFSGNQLVWVDVGGEVESPGVMRTRALQATSETGTTADQRRGYVGAPFRPHITVAIEETRDSAPSQQVVNDSLAVGKFTDFEATRAAIYAKYGTRYRLVTEMVFGA
jgi:2'-5' RNA ligase